ncbi:2-oxo acid dehydrogenase subunit E2, partial [bacterium]|nr:2-oxo acid dehydrogenase subunit E2 [bacterium]
MYEITMPKLSDSMEEGKIIEWRVREGDEVHEGDVLAEVESDKAAMELECFQDGVLAKIVHGDGDVAPVGAVIGYIGEAGEAVAEPAVPSSAKATEGRPAPKPEPKPIPEAPKPKPAPKSRPKPVPSLAPAGGRVAVSPYARKLAQQKGVDLSAIAGTGPGGRIVARDIESAPAGQPMLPPSAAPTDVEPMARALAAQYLVDLAAVVGTGAEGTVTVHDVAHVHEARAGVAEPAASADEDLPELVVREDEADVEEASYRMKTIARRVVASKHVIPHFYVTRGVDVTELLARRGEAKEKYAATVTHLLMLAIARTLGEHPAVNRSYDRGKIFTWKGIHLGIAVDTDDGLTVAVLRNAQGMDLAQIAERTRGLVEKARGGKLSPEERRHPTFTISNLGMLDVEHFQPIINPPSSVTLGVSSALPTPVIDGDSIHIGQVMRLTMSCDHRILDGAAAARVLNALKT